MNSLAERWAQRVLALGFIVALLGVGIGLFLRLFGLAYSHFFVSVGFWALLCAPTLRVLALFFAFLAQKEVRYAWASAGVLFVLAVSYFIEKL